MYLLETKDIECGILSRLGVSFSKKDLLSVGT